MDLRSKIILIYGPTASGKSKFAVKLAKKISGQIINADSMQVYKELKVLTARPFKKDNQKIKHHLYGFQSAKKNFSTGDWLKLAKQKILQCKKIKQTPILVGGTGLYFKALTDGLVNIPKIPFNFRNKVRNLHKRIGQKKFFLKLLKIDPLIKNRVNSSDVQRSIRAYEIKLFTKKSIVSWFRNTLLKQGVDFNNDETSLNFNNLLAYFENYLDWLANMIHFSQNATVQGIDLVDVNMFSQYENSQVTISDKVRDHQLKQFNSLISGVNSSSLAKVFLKMNYSRVPKNRTGIGAFVGALYESCKG